MVNRKCHCQLGKPKWESVYHHPILSKDGDVAWRILHNRIITPQQLPNYLQALDKTTIYEINLATNNPHHQPPDYQRMFRMRLQYRLHIEMHHSIWQHDIETFTSYLLHRNIVGKIQEGRIILNYQI
jgi:hypothetical protein